MKYPLERVSCARLPTSGLSALAGLRRFGGISVLRQGECSLVFWEAGDDRILRAVLPLGGVELFERRGDTWHHAGHRLPCFGFPPAGEPIPLAQAVIPEPFAAEFPGEDAPRPIRLGLARDGRPRPTTAALCPLAELGRWADSATSAELGAIHGAVSGAWGLLVGRPLPPWTGAERFWGRKVLVPIGFEPRPRLPESAIREAFGASDDVLLRLVQGPEGTAVESIPFEAFRRLTRAGVRRALAGARPS